jgi:hypothetical protein
MFSQLSQSEQRLLLVGYHYAVGCAEHSQPHMLAFEAKILLDRGDMTELRSVLRSDKWTSLVSKAIVDISVPNRSRH